MLLATAEAVLRLDADAWSLQAPQGRVRLPLSAPAVEVLGRLEVGATSGARRLKVVLGDGVVRYLALRWPDGLKRAAERGAWLTHRFQSVHGVGAPDWTLVSDWNAVGPAALACAAPSPLLEAIRGFAAQRRLRLAGVSGDFADCFNAVRRDLDDAAGDYGLLALARGGRVTAGLWQAGTWLAVRSQIHGEDAGAEVCRMLEGWLAGLAPETGGRQRVGVLHALGFAPRVPAGWRARRLDGAP